MPDEKKKPSPPSPSPPLPPGKSFVLMPEDRIYRVNHVLDRVDGVPLMDMHQLCGGLHEVDNKVLKEYVALGGIAGEALESRMKHEPAEAISRTPSAFALKKWAERSDCTDRAKQLIKVQLADIARARAKRGAPAED